MRALRSFAASAADTAAIDPGSIAAGDAAAVRALAFGARVIGVGEAAHSVADVQAMQDLIVRALVQDPGTGPGAGAAAAPETEPVAAIALESGFAESLALDAWVGGAGDDTDLDTVARDGMTYGFGASPQVQCMLAGLRDWNREHPGRRVRVIGIDLPGSSTSPGPAVRACLDRIPPQPGDAALRRRSDLGGRTEAAIALDRMTGAEHAELVAGIRAVIERAGAHGDGIARRSAASLAAFLAELDFVDDPDPDGPLGPYPRERFMADTVRWIAGRHGRTVVLAHNSHVRRTPLHGRPTLGSLLTEELGDAYRVIATSYAYGPLVRFEARSSRPFDCDVLLDHRGPVPGSLEAALERILPAPETVGTDSVAVLLRLDRAAEGAGDPGYPDGAGRDPALAELLADAHGILAGGELDPVDDFPAAFDAVVHLREANRVPGAFERLRAEFGLGVPDPKEHP